MFQVEKEIFPRLLVPVENMSIKLCAPGQIYNLNEKVGL